MGEANDFVRVAVSEKVAKVREMAGAVADEAKEQGLTFKAPAKFSVMKEGPAETCGA